jgi:hypothetical protein
METKQFYSQRGEDKWIFENLDLPENGTFLDIGCNHYENNNNTYAFEKYLGWSGTAIDISFVHAAGYAKERPKTEFYAGAILPNNWPVKTIEVLPDERNNGELIRMQPSSENGTVSVCGIKVKDLLRYSPSPCLLSLDVEGMEKTILHDILKVCKPKILIVEHSTLGLPFDETLLPFITSHGYTLRHTTDFNFILTI